MDHYSLEVLGKLHHKELVREGVRSQAVRRAESRKYLSKHWKRILFVATVTLLMYFYFFCLANLVRNSPPSPVDTRA